MLSLGLLLGKEQIVAALQRRMVLGAWNNSFSQAAWAGTSLPILGLASRKNVSLSGRAYRDLEEHLALRKNTCSWRNYRRACTQAVRCRWVVISLTIDRRDVLKRT